MDHGPRDQEPGMLKKRDFRVKGGNNFLSIHAANILNHTPTHLPVRGRQISGPEDHSFNLTLAVLDVELGWL
jgi:hypothetical protein